MYKNAYMVYGMVYFIYTYEIHSALCYSEGIETLKQTEVEMYELHTVVSLGIWKNEKKESAVLLYV